MSNDLLLWNKLGSDSEVLNSETGVNGVLTQPVHYLPIQYDDGVALAKGTAQVKFDSPFGTAFPAAGTIEFWWVPGHSENTSTGSHYAEREAFVLSSDQTWTITSPPDFPAVNLNLVYRSHGPVDQTVIQFWAEDAGGTIHNYGTVYDLNFIEGELHHFAVVWGGSVPITLFVDGQEITPVSVSIEGSGDPIPTIQTLLSDGSFTYDLELLRWSKRPDGADHSFDDDSYLDNLKIWNYAKSDFTDRFWEDGVTIGIVGDSGPNILIGTSDTDLLLGLTGDDRLYGLAATDILVGGPGHDMVFGGDGDDFSLLGRGGTDVIFGGNDDDIFLDGGGKSDTVYGDGGQDSLLFGRGDNDTLSGGDGDDLSLFGGAGDDVVFGGSGADTRLVGGVGDDTVAGGSGADVALLAGSGADRLYGGFGDDTRLFGGRGDDFIYGGEGDDSFLRGKTGQDHIEGESGNDLAFGGSGQDLLIGGAGRDQLYGDDGDDTFQIASQADIQAGEIYDGGTGTDTLVLATGVSLPGTAVFTGIEVILYG